MFWSPVSNVPAPNFPPRMFHTEFSGTKCSGHCLVLPLFAAFSTSTTVLYPFCFCLMCNISRLIYRAVGTFWHLSLSLLSIWLIHSIFLLCSLRSSMTFHVSSEIQTSFLFPLLDPMDSFASPCWLFLKVFQMSFGYSSEWWVSKHLNRLRIWIWNSSLVLAFDSFSIERAYMVNSCAAFWVWVSHLLPADRWYVSTSICACISEGGVLPHWETDVVDLVLCFAVLGRS